MLTNEQHVTNILKQVRKSDGDTKRIAKTLKGYTSDIPLSHIEEIVNEVRVDSEIDNEGIGTFLKRYTDKILNYKPIAVEEQVTEDKPKEKKKNLKSFTFK